MEALPACLLMDVYQEALGSAVIGIDEGQFVSVWPRQVLGSSVGRSLFSAPCAEGGLNPLWEGGMGRHTLGQFDPAGLCWYGQTLPLVPAG